MQMTGLKKVALCVIGLVITSTGHTDSSLAGGGTFSCGKYVEWRRTNNERYQYSVIWTQGFLSGLNIAKYRETGKFSSIPSPETIGLMLESECLTYPTEQIWKVAELIFTSLDELK